MSFFYSYLVIFGECVWFLFSFLTDGGEDDGDDEMEDSYIRSMEMDPCTSSNELR